jgi:uncharacterized protein (UPF0261 family)
MRTTPEENCRMGEIFAEKLNRATSPVAVYVPMKGFSEIDAPGQPFWWPEADRAFLEGLQKSLRKDIEVQVLDMNVNDPEFSGAVANRLLEMLKK